MCYSSPLYITFTAITNKKKLENRTICIFSASSDQNNTSLICRITATVTITHLICHSNVFSCSNMSSRGSLLTTLVKFTMYESGGSVA